MKSSLTVQQRAWIDALRSGQYQQTRNVLHNNEGFCCLGVACDLFKDDLNLKVKNQLEGIRYNDLAYSLPREVCDLLRIKERERKDGGRISPPIVREELESCLSNLPQDQEAFQYYKENEGNRIEFLSDLNDQGFSFQCIANVIETYSDRIFDNYELPV